MLFRIGFAPCALALLAMAAGEDVRTGEVSHWLAFFPWLIFTTTKVLTLTYQGGPLAGGSAIGLALLMIAFLTDADVASFILTGAALLVTGLVTGTLPPVVAIAALSLVAWRLGIFGAADAEVLSALAVLFPDYRLGMAVAGTFFVCGVVVLYRRYGRALPFAVAGPLQDLRLGRVPAHMAKEELEGLTWVPLTAWIFLGALVYQLWIAVA